MSLCWRQKLEAWEGWKLMEEGGEEGVRKMWLGNTRVLDEVVVVAVGDE